MSRQTIALLPDFSPSYMTDSKLHWSDFKKSLKENAMAWGFRQWFNTTVYGGAKWKELAKLGLKLKQEDDDEQLPDVEDVMEEKADDGDVVAEEKAPMPVEVMKIMGYSQSEVEYFQASTRFVNVLTGFLETVKQGIARQKLWGWMVKSLFGQRTTPGPYYYLVDEVAHSDVAALYQQLIRVIDTPTMVSQADDLAAVFLYPFDPRSQDIFNYYGEIKKLVRRVHDLNPLLPEGSKIILPDTVVRALLLRAMKLIPLYKTVLDSFIIKKPEEWATFSADDLYKHLEQINTNSRGITQKNGASTSTSEGAVHANAVRVKGKSTQEKKPCFSFSKTGVCNRTNCKFSHDAKDRQAPSQPSTKPDSKSAEAKSEPVSCQNCGDDHTTQKCKFDGKCGHCGKLGHKELLCRSKKAGKPKALLLDAEGSAVHATCS
jgi:hypothetical protein